VAGLTLVGLALRVAGVSYGLPRLYHDDTPKQLYRVGRFMAGELIPRDAYPTPHIYVVAAVLKVVAWLDPHAFQDGLPIGYIAVTARLLNATLGAAMVPLLYLAGRRLLGAPAGVLAAALAALSPLLVLHAHYEMGDVFQTFFVTLAFAAAARALVTGGAGALVLGGVAAGLATAAKFYGVLAFAPVVIAAAAGPYGARRRRIALLARAGAAVGLAFVLATPMAWLAPLSYPAAFREVLETIPPPPLLARPYVAALGIVGHSLEWFDPLLLAAGAVGVGLLLRRREPRALLPLVVPALVLPLYVVARAHRLDDRNLVILAPFLFLTAAAAVAWLGSLRRWLRPVAAGLAVALVGWSALNGAHVAYLFWQDDTRQFAQRWLATADQPDLKPLALTYHDSVEGYRATGAGLLVLESKEWRAATVWFATNRSSRIERGVAFLEAQGKLLKRFELWPRAFTSPTLAYYDLDSLGVAHAFPPPDTVAPVVDHLLFLDDAAVPEAPGLFVAHRRPAETTLVSRDPLPRLTLALSGEGLLRIDQGGHLTRVPVERGRLAIVTIPLRRAFPWFKHFYPIRLEIRGGDGHVYARLLTSPCQMGRAHLAYAQWAAAVPHLEACRGRWEEPARLLDLAWARAQLGDGAAARQAVARLGGAAPGLLEELADLARREDGKSWRERYRQLGGHDRWFWNRQSATLQAEAKTRERAGIVVERPGAAGHHVVWMHERSGPGYLKLWFPQTFLRGRHLVRFRLRVADPGRGEGPQATFSVVRHFEDMLYDVPVSRPWRGRAGGDGFEEVVLPLETELEPIRLEARVEYHGRGHLEIDEVTVLPDVKGGLAAKLDALRRVGALP
jgi:hypothetical protein